MKKITIFIMFLAISTMLKAQTAPTFTWTNKSDFMIGDDLIAKPGDVINFSIDYTLGTTLVEAVDTPNTFNFILFGFQFNTDSEATVFTAGWSNFTPVVINYPGPGVAGTTTGSITIPLDTPLSSVTTNAYRILTYLAYNKGGGAVQYGGDGASDPVLIKIMSAGEVSALSIEDFENSPSIGAYPNPTNGIVNFGQESEVYTVFDVTGRLVSSQKGGKSIDITSLQSGIYSVKTDFGIIQVIKN